jgi:hypothetical protein
MTGKYERCLRYGHDWMIEDDKGSFDEARFDMNCKRCDATAEVIGDVRTQDGRHIEYDLAS